MSLQFKTEGNGTVWFDNIYFWKAPAVAGTELSDLTLDGEYPLLISDQQEPAILWNFHMEQPPFQQLRATTTDTNASAVVTDATSIPGTTTIAITAQDGSNNQYGFDSFFNIPITNHSCSNTQPRQCGCRLCLQ